jgi:hypothetical protein
MLRKITLGLIAAASLSVAALAPGSASAHGFHSGWGYGGWGYGGPGFYINTGVKQLLSAAVGSDPSRHAPAHRERLRLHLLIDNPLR